MALTGWPVSNTGPGLKIGLVTSVSFVVADELIGQFNMRSLAKHSFNQPDQF